MRIGLICPVWFPVPPEAYGGTERVVALLADGLVDADHEVTLFASGDSQTRARLESVFHTAPSEWIGHTYWEMQHALHAFLKADEFDVLHDHTGMLGLAFGGLVPTRSATRCTGRSTASRAACTSRCSSSRRRRS